MPYTEGQTATNPRTGQRIVYRNGRWVTQTSNGQTSFDDSIGIGANPSAETRSRIAVQYAPARDAVQQLDNLEREQGNVLNNNAFASTLDASSNGTLNNAVSRFIGGDDYQQYQSAAKTFESAVLPIMSGAAVTDSEAARQIRAALPQLGDNDAVLRDKAIRRRQMVNSIANMGRQQRPFPNNQIRVPNPNQPQGRYTPAQMRTLRGLGAIAGQGGTRGNPRMPTTQREYDSIPNGHWVIDDDGHLFRKGARR